MKAGQIRDGMSRQGNNLVKQVKSMKLRMITANDLKWLFGSKWFPLTVDFVSNLAMFLVSYIYSAEYKLFSAAPMVIMILNVLMFGLFVYQRMDAKNKVSTRRLRFLKYTLQTLWLVILTMIVAKVIQEGSGTIRDPLYLGQKYADRLALSYAKRSGILAVSIISIFCDFYVLTVCWTFKFTFVTLIFAFSFIINFVLGLLQIQLNMNNLVKVQGRYYRMTTYFTHVGALNIAGSVFGICLTLTMTKSSRFSPIFRRLITLLDICLIICTILSTIAFSLSVYILQNNNLELSKALLILFGCAMFITVTAIWSSRKLSERDPVTYKAERINLKDLKPYQKEAYAKLISSNSRSNPGVTGEAVMPLMETYCETKLDNLNCYVLRVYNPNKTDKNLAAETSKKYADNPSSVYEDNEKFFFGEAKEDYSEKVLDNLKPMSKNQRKRLMKKQAASNKNVQLPTNGKFTAENFEEEMEFYSQLLSTEALVLLSVISEYDLTSQIPGRIGRMLGKLFGRNSFSKLLCIRVGLLAFHWPFRRSTFYTSSTKNAPVRDAAIMNAITKFNGNQKKKCTVLISPIISSTNTDKVINLSEWINIPLPPSNIIDMRPHLNKTSQKYFKEIKYRVQSEAFKRAGGEVIQDKQFSPEYCQRAINLWSNIALSRSENGFSSYFTNPDCEFFETIGTHENKDSSRTLLFLKIDGECIASCVLFRLGHTITSDLQGLDYEKGKNHKAYFVMMEAVINIALEEGFSFIDFGPTTDSAKQSIGSQSVHITGALYTRIPCMSGIVKFAASKVNV